MGVWDLVGVVGSGLASFGRSGELVSSSAESLGVGTSVVLSSPNGWGFGKSTPGVVVGAVLVVVLGVITTTVGPSGSSSTALLNSLLESSAGVETAFVASPAVPGAGLIPPPRPTLLFGIGGGA